MEDNCAAYDGSVRNAQNAIVQFLFLYGGDGCDPCRLERVPLEALLAPEERLRALFGEGELADEELARLRPLLGALRRGRVTAAAPALDGSVLLPINVERAVRQATATAGGGEPPVAPRAAFEAVGALLLNGAPIL